MLKSNENIFSNSSLSVYLVIFLNYLITLKSCFVNQTSLFINSTNLAKNQNYLISLSNNLTIPLKGCNHTIELGFCKELYF